MKNARVWITLSGGLASGLLAGYLALVYVSEEPAPLKAEELKGTQIVVAGRDLATGTILTREDLEIFSEVVARSLVASGCQPGMMMQLAALLSEKASLGRSR